MMNRIGIFVSTFPFSFRKKETFQENFGCLLLLQSCDRSNPNIGGAKGCAQGKSWSASDLCPNRQIGLSEGENYGGNNKWDQGHTRLSLSRCKQFFHQRNSVQFSPAQLPSPCTFFLKDRRSGSLIDPYCYRIRVLSCWLSVLLTFILFFSQYNLDMFLCVL